MGKIKTASGQYEGQWKKNKWHGIGAYTYTDGKTYTGYFQNGYKVGMGTFTWGEDEERIEKWKSSNDIRDQIYKKTAALLEKENYKEMDSIAQKYRKSKALLANGLWKLTTFYNAVNDVPNNAPEEKWLSHQERLERWIKQEPNSITAQIALADFYIDYAFHARGYNWASQVTDEGWKLFRERLEKSAGVLAQAEKLTAKCPHYW